MTIKAAGLRACLCGAKRAYEDSRDAEKALGRVQAKRHRAGDRRGTRRGLSCENRIYRCGLGMYHLTSQSRSDYLGAAA
ncbi:hypothetical protein ABZ419_09915 [Streptomyces cinnamoneus]|uniref:hypothetical protein n=1 Tax=Streptomyces cinnamoneus TaxID=53446 RepID=UPI003409D925